MAAEKGLGGEAVEDDIISDRKKNSFACSDEPESFLLSSCKLALLDWRIC
jgi:hypothetical protein